MGIVDPQRLHRYMSEPRWTDGQWAEATELCEELEATLASLLNTKITPTPFRETVAVLDTGLVATSYPVHAVRELNGATVAEGDPLPDGWILREHRVRRDDETSPLLTGSSPLLIGLSFGPAGRVQGQGAVTIDYEAGWGEELALRSAILTKAAAIMTNRHDDTVLVRDLNAIPPAPFTERWTEDDLRPLGIYRNLLAFR